MVGGSQRGSQKNWAAKVKTGCLTCKRRRVKCDETRPSCFKCGARGVECGGYREGISGGITGRYAATRVVSGWEVVTPETVEMEMAMGSMAGGTGVDDWDVGSCAYGSTATAISLPVVSTPTSEGGNSHDRGYRDRSSDSVVRCYAPATIAAWTEMFSPYTTPEQRVAMDVWMDLAPSMSRSQQGLTYWSVSLPTIAWGHAAVRNAMTATSIVFHSLRQKDGPRDYNVAQANALVYANECVRELVATKTPPEAMIACSSLLWIFEMLMGNWTSSMVHLAAGTRIAKSTRLSTLSDPFVAQYIRSFVGGLPASINPVVIMGMSREDQGIQSDVRHRYARFIMRDALDRLEVFQARLDLMQSARKDRAIQIIGRTAGELDRIYQQWPVNTVVNHDEPEVFQQAIRDHSPFIQVIQNAEVFFQDHDISHLTEFETWFRPCVDHFIWLAVCLHLQHRQHMIEVWNVKRQVLPLTNRLLPTTEVEDI